MKKGLLIVFACFLVSYSFSQNNPPVAVDDTVAVISQVESAIYPLTNDYDPDGDSIFLFSWNGPSNGNLLADTINGIFQYKSSNDPSDLIRYKLRDNGIPQKFSQTGWIWISILPNPEMPVSNPDTFDLIELVPHNLDLMLNDTDPHGYPLRLYAVDDAEHCSVSLSDDSLTVIIIPTFVSDWKASFKYAVVEVNSPDSLISAWTTVLIKITPNPDIPIIVNDTALATGGIPENIPVLSNDYDPQGEPIEIHYFGQPQHGSVHINGDTLVYSPDLSYKGLDRFYYGIREVNDTNIYTKSTWVTVSVSKNPHCPVGVPDQASGVTYKPMVIDVLANDFDPDGQQLQIKDVDSVGKDTIVDNKIKHKSTQGAIDHETIYYRVSKKYDPSFYSEWTPVEIDLAANPDLPVAVQDFAEVSPFYPTIVNALANDIKNKADTLIISYTDNTSKCSAKLTDDNRIAIQSFSNCKGLDTIHYVIKDLHNDTLSAPGKIYVDIQEGHLYDSLTINNINAGVNCDGMLFTNITEIPGQGLKGKISQHFKYPKGTETNTIFNSSMWFGGIAGQDSLYFAGERYRQMGADFQPGPVSNSYDSNYAAKYWKLWKLNKSEVEYHLNNWWKPGYSPIEDIASWPGNGDVVSGQAAQLAPYSDYNQDGKYNPMDGDYPLIRGDQTIFLIYNDDKIHSESKGNRLKIEVHSMVYGYNSPEDSSLNNTVFVHYDLINRSDKVYQNTYGGIFTDFDLGNPWDDYIASEVQRASFYCYNGDEFDENYLDFSYSSAGYGEFPPAQSVTVLAGPFLDSDGLDDPSGGCDFSVNGINFGNGITDDERFGLSRFVFFNNYGNDPYIAPEFYSLMDGYWPDGTRFKFGGNGHGGLSEGLDCNFLYPGDSDPMNWGTNCIDPGYPYNQDGFYWTESSSFNVPGDRRGLGIMGPFTFVPGQVQEIELAYCVANGWNGPVSSVVQLMKNIDSLRSRVNNGEIIVPNSSLGVIEKKVPADLLRIYPNPASTNITIRIPAAVSSGTEYLVYNVLGDVVRSGRIASYQQFTVNISGLQPGFYILKVISRERQISGKFIKR
jgi:hypothetical protein